MTPARNESDRFRENVDRLNALREKAAGHSVLKAAAFTIAAFDAMPALIAIAETGDPRPGRPDGSVQVLTSAVVTR